MINELMHWDMFISLDSYFNVLTHLSQAWFQEKSLKSYIWRMVYLSSLHRCYATLLESHVQVFYLQPKTAVKESVQKRLHKPLR